MKLKSPNYEPSDQVAIKPCRVGVNLPAQNEDSEMRKSKTLVTVLIFAAAFGLTPAFAQPFCGDTISVDTTLVADVGPCAGDGLTIDTAGVTLDLNSFSIIGSGICPGDPDCFTSAFSQTGSGVIVDGVADVTISNGTIEDSFRIGIEIRAGSDGTLVEDLDIKDYLVFAINVFDADDVVVRHTKMKNLAGNGLDVIVSDNFSLVDNDIKTAGQARRTFIPDGQDCGLGNGIFIYQSDGFQFLNNKFSDISQSAILVWESTNGLIDNNEVKKSNFLPCGPPTGTGSTDFGAITINGGAGASENIVVSANTLKDNPLFAIGLRASLVDIQVHHNRLEKNGTGILLSSGPQTGTSIHNNCISRNTTGVGPGAVPLSGSDEEIVQQADDTVDVEPFLDKCPLKGKK